MTNISNSLTKDILKYLGVSQKPPTLRYLNLLIYAYIHTVPWESVSRIKKRHKTPQTKNCPRLPEEFWKDALQYGFGGTCYESSLAFYSFLSNLGYCGYLTVNDMGVTIGCHAAIIIIVNGQKYLVDITIPVHAAVRIDPHKSINRKTSLFDYKLRPVSEHKYEVERSHRPTKNLFTLIDVPVSLPDFLAIVEDDYSETNGRFLKSVVMVKVVAEKAQRFFSDQMPYRLESFDRAGRVEKIIEPETLPTVLAEVFHLPEEEISFALSMIKQLPVKIINQAITQPIFLEGSPP